MDVSVAPAQSYRRVNGYFTVAEFSIVATERGAGGQRVLRTVTDADVLALSMAPVLEFVRSHLRTDWKVFYTGGSKDPALAMLLLEEKARRGTQRSVRAATNRPEKMTS